MPAMARVGLRDQPDEIEEGKPSLPVQHIRVRSRRGET